METTLLDRYAPLVLARGKKIRNRVVIPPMASQTGDAEGFVTEETLAHYQRLLPAAAGLLIVEYTFIHLSGRSEPRQLGIQSDAHIKGLSRLARRIRASGALAGIQITHGGGKSDRSLTGGALQAPSALATPVKDRQLEVPKPMSIAELDLWKAAFLHASDRAVAAGFELIEIHAAHGYGLNQWLSPLTNRRMDSYGGSLENRLRLVLEIVALIRARHPQLLISVRIPGQDFMPGGFSPQEAVRLAEALESVGVDLLHVSSGIGGWRRPAAREGEGYLVQDAELIQSAVGIPVIGVGGIETGQFIDEGLRRGRFQLAAVGRAVLRDPRGWGEGQLLSEILAQKKL